MKLFLLLVLWSVGGYCAELPKAINNKQQLQQCIEQNTQDCITAACSAAAPIDCADQCKIDAENKCEELEQQQR